MAAIPDLDGISLSTIAKQAGVSRSLVSRMLAKDVAQPRTNPGLETMEAICRAVEVLTGTPLSLDLLARAIRGTS